MINSPIIQNLISLFTKDEDSIIIYNERKRQQSQQNQICTKSQSENNNSQHFLNFPDELIVLISKTLSLQDIMNCRLVCKSLSAIYNDISIWKGRFFLIRTRSIFNQKNSLINLTKRPSGRLCPSSVSYKNSIYIYGGDNGFKDQYMNLIGDVKSDLWYYDIEKNIWVDIIQDIGVRPRLTEHSAIVWNDSMILFGGSTGGIPQYSNNIYSFNFNTKTMVHVKTTGEVPNPRSAHTAVCYQDYMYIFGGWDGTESNNDTYKLNLKTNVWSQIKTHFSPSKRRAHCSVLYNDSIYVFGGFDTSKKPETFNALYKFCLKTETWSEVECFGDIPKGRSRASMIEFNNKLYMIGGWDRCEYFQELHEFNLETNNWKKLDANIEEMNIGLGQNSVCVYQNRMFIFGGYIPNKKTSTNELFSIRLS